MRLDGKRVVIIGGSSGIGLETARLALAEGASITIAGRSEGRLQRAAESLVAAGNVDRLRAVVADIAVETSIQALFASETRVDHVFLPAGELRPGGGDVLGTELEGLRSILEVRLLGVALVLRHAKPRMEGGSITLMSGLYSNAPGSRRSDGGCRRRRGGGYDQGTGIGFGPDSGQCGGSRPDRHAALGRLRPATGSICREGRQAAGPTDRPAGGGGRGGPVPDVQRVCHWDRLADRRRGWAGLNGTAQMVGWAKPKGLPLKDNLTRI